MKNEPLLLNEYIPRSEQRSAKYLWLKENLRTLKTNEKYKQMSCSLKLKEDEKGLLR